jgi:hypothetical protein
MDPLTAKCADALGLVSGHVLPAIDLQNLPGHIAAHVLGGQVEERSNAIVWGAKAIHRDRHLHGAELLRCRVALMEWSHDDSGRDRVYPDPILHEFLRPATCRYGHKALCRGVDHGAGPTPVAPQWTRR